MNVALGHHLFQITQAEIVCQIPPYAQQDYRSVEVTAIEHRRAPEMEKPLCFEQCYREVCDRARSFRVPSAISVDAAAVSHEP